MTTEVQIRKNHSHLSHLRKVVSCTASRLGMSRRDIEATENAVSEVCSISIGAASDSAGDSLSIKLSAHETCLMVEITDPSSNPARASSNQCPACHSSMVECIRRLVDDVEFFAGAEGATTRIVKYARKPEPLPGKPIPYAPALGTTASQS